MRTMHVVDGFLNLLRLGVLACVAAVAACSPRSDNSGVASGPDAVLGIWMPDAAPQRLLAVNGSPAPLTPEAGRVHARATRAPAIRRTCVRPDHVVCWTRHASCDDDALSLRDPTGRGLSRLHPRLVPLASGRRSGRRRGRRPAAPAHDGLPGRSLGRRYAGDPHRRIERRHGARRHRPASLRPVGADRAPARTPGWALGRSPHHRGSGHLHDTLGSRAVLPPRRRGARRRRHLSRPDRERRASGAYRTPRAGGRRWAMRSQRSSSPRRRPIPPPLRHRA